MPVPASLVYYMKTVKFYTVGCKVNQYETQAIKEQFSRAGFKEVDNGRPAGVYLINSCTVTHKADRDSRRFVHLASRQNPKAKIIVTGCYAELDSREISKIPGVSLIVKNRDKDKIASLLNATNETNSINETNDRGINSFSGHTRAFLKIQDGCDNFCSYCKVPLVRGRSRSRPLGEVVLEAERLAGNGFKEIVLCGICLGAYGKDLRPRLSLIDAIDALEKLEGLLRIRLSSIEAADVTDELIEKLKESDKLCRHLHIPFQSGDNGILKKMNRKSKFQDYIKLVNKLKKSISGIAITCDIMAGFPSETEENFKNTVKLIKRVAPLKAHIFSYSSRKGTLAYNIKDKIEAKIIKKRVLELQKIARECAQAYKKRFLRKKIKVIIEAEDKKESGCWQGLTDNYIPVRVESGQNLKNRLICVVLKKLIGDFIEADIY